MITDNKTVTVCTYEIFCHVFFWQVVSTDAVMHRMASVEYEPVPKAFADWLTAKSMKKAGKKDDIQEFFGLKRYHNADVAAGNGTGYPLWLCHKCGEGLKCIVKT